MLGLWAAWATQTPFQKVGAKPPTFWEGFWAAPGSPDTENNRFSTKSNFQYGGVFVRHESVSLREPI